MHAIEPLFVAFSSMSLAPSPTISFQLLDAPGNLNLLAVLDYELWESDLEGEEKVTLLEITPASAPTISQFPKVESGKYYIIGYFDGEDELHQVVHIPLHVDNFSLRITQNAGEYELEASPGVEMVET
ncbi:MAG: hypothetical protein KF898_08375 [Parachlamydiales bacterium]|nr:hypothetical protein [Verrucomicrobiota bacterium]MBX3719647.1 hypothetical protein [Candidatus Acheromyda pituitae]